MSDVQVEKLSGITSTAAPRARGALAAGSAAGLAAGGAMAATLVAIALVEGAPALLAFHAIGAVLPGVTAGSPAAVLAGVLAHAVVSGALGAVFAGIVPRDFPPTCAAGVGVGYALFAMGLAVSIALPASFVSELHDIGGGWVVAHAVYGAVLGLALAPAAGRGRTATP